jgi:hypothetical protein
LVSAVAVAFALTAAPAFGKVPLRHESAARATEIRKAAPREVSARVEKSPPKDAREKVAGSKTDDRSTTADKGKRKASSERDDGKSAHSKEVAHSTVDDASWRPYRKAPWHRGYVSLFGHGKKWSGYLIGPKGHVLPAARASLSQALASWRTGKEILIDDRLIELIARTSDEFGGRAVRIVSGYREMSYAPGSKHKVGQAFDFSIPGVPNASLKDYLRSLPDVGVGFYPNSTHVHLDVRDKPTYWVDYSAPGERPMYAWDRRAPHWTPRDRAIAAALDALPLRILASEPAATRQLPMPEEDEREPDPGGAR